MADGSSEALPRPSSIYHPQLFSGRNAVITGGGTGIGLRIAREFVMLGMGMWPACDVSSEHALRWACRCSIEENGGDREGSESY